MLCTTKIFIIQYYGVEGMIQNSFKKILDSFLFLVLKKFKNQNDINSQKKKTKKLI